MALYAPAKGELALDLTPLYSTWLGQLYWLVPALILIAFLKSPFFKGWLGEALVKLSTKLFLPSDQYHAFHNVTLPTLDGTTQIDHIFVSEFGVFVVETKNMKGWIFGSEKQAQWTQKIFKQSYKFQNPLRQNYKHLKALESALGLPAESFHSIVVFVGDSSFKTPMPENVIRGGDIVSHIKTFQRPKLAPEQVAQAVRQIESGRLAPTLETHRQHVDRLKSRSDATSEQTCARCGSPMVLRTAKQGPNAGRQFWGCSTFPQCRTTIKID